MSKGAGGDGVGWAGEQLVFICETWAIALCVIFNLTGFFPPTNISLPCFLSDFLPSAPTLLCSVFSRPVASIPLTFVTVWTFPHVSGVSETLFVL